MSQSRKRRGKRRTKALTFHPALNRISDLRDAEDITAAIVAATLLEGALERAISKRMCRFSAKEHNEIFHIGGPLRNLRPKILMGRALNLYGPETAAELIKIGDIRNEFAHNVAQISFKTARVQDLCFELKRPEMRAVDFFAMVRGQNTPVRLQDDVIRACPKLRYLKTVTVLLFLLETSTTARPTRERAPWPRFSS